MRDIRMYFWKRNAVKESFDNLPSGMCYFSDNGFIVLCNYQMTKLIHMMTGRDVQSLNEMNAMLQSEKTEMGAVKEDSCYLLPDGTSWKFTINQIRDSYNKLYYEVLASDVTDLRRNQQLLLQANEAKRQTVTSLEQIQKNVVAITREEEILSLKMHIHNEFGYNLQAIRRYFKHDCPVEEKKDFVRKQKEIIQKMYGELRNDDAIDPINELKQLSEALDMQIIINGQIPEIMRIRELIAFIIRECLTNTVRHAQGDYVFVEVMQEKSMWVVQVTNNGIQPEQEITEGGGLTSLRVKLENAGGSMNVMSLPVFKLTAEIPLKGDIYDTGTDC